MSVPPIDPLQNSNVEHLPASSQKTSVWERCPFLKLISKIYKAALRFFAKIKEYFSPSPYNLSQKDIDYLESTRSRFRPPSPSPSQKIDLRKRHVIATTVEEIQSPEETETEVRQDDKNVTVTTSFHDAALGFVDHALEATYDEVIVPMLPDLHKKVRDFQNFLKVGADVVISLGSSLKSPLEEKLAAFNISELLEPDMKKLMQWLLKNKEKINQIHFVTELEKKVGHTISEDLRKEAIEKCREWLFDTDQSLPLIPDAGWDLVNTSVIEKVFKEAIVILSNQRISEFNEKVQKNLDENLASIIENMIMNNGHKIADIALKRLIKILYSAPFSETFDAIIGLLADQSSAVVDAEKARERKKREVASYLIRCDHAAVDSPHENDVLEADRQELIESRNLIISESVKVWVNVKGEEAQKDAIKEAKLHLQNLEQKNEEPEDIHDIREKGIGTYLQEIGEKAKEEAITDAEARIQAVSASDDDDVKKELNKEMRELWLESEGELAARDTYRKLLVEKKTFCHPKIEELELVTDETLAKSDAKPTGELEKIMEVLLIMMATESQNEEHLFDESAKKLISLLFPSVTVVDQEGKRHEIDGLLYQFDQIEYEESIKTLYEEAGYIYEEVLTDEKQKKIVSLIQKNLPTIEKCVLRLSKHHAKVAISKAIAAIFQKFIIPEKIDEMMTHDALPAFQETLVESLAKNILSDHLQKYSPMFRLLVDSVDNKDELRKNLMNTLKSEVAENLQSHEIEDDKLEELVASEVKFLEDYLTGFSNDRENIDDENRDALFESALKKFFETQYHGNNSRYGDLVVNTVFKLGNLNSTAESFASWFKGTLSKEITAATHVMRESPKYLLEKTVEQIKRRYSEKKDVKHLLFAKTPEYDKLEIQKELEAELTKTAKIAHALLFYQSTQQSWLARKSIQWIIGFDHTKIDQVIKRVYHKMLGNTLYSQNLMVRLQEGISKMLQQGSEAVASNTRPLQVERVPSLLPVFV